MIQSANPEPEDAPVRGPRLLALAEAQRLGYTLTAADCRQQLTIRTGEVSRLLASGELPSALVQCRRAVGYRVRSADLSALLERACVPSPPLPVDLTRAVEAIEIIAGQRERSGTKRNSRIRQRLHAAVKRGDVTRYLLFGSRTRYSRREVEAERDRLGAPAMTPRKHHAALRKRMAAQALLDTATAGELAGVPQSTARGWAKRGLYGAQKLDGQWWLERALLPRARRPYAPPMSVACARCHQVHGRPAWEVRGANQKGHRLYCPACWDEVGDSVIDENLGKARGVPHVITEEARERIGAAQKRRWDGASGDQRATKRDALRTGHDAMLKSPKRRVAMASNIMRARLGREPTVLEVQRWRGRATARAVAASEKGAARRAARDELDDRITAELDGGMTVAAAALEVHVSERRVQFAARRRGRPAGNPGRPRKPEQTT